MTLMPFDYLFIDSLDLGGPKVSFHVINCGLFSVAPIPSATLSQK